jgi:hypothetical protein
MSEEPSVGERPPLGDTDLDRLAAAQVAPLHPWDALREKGAIWLVAARPDQDGASDSAARRAVTRES